MHMFFQSEKIWEGIDPPYTRHNVHLSFLLIA